MPSFLPTTAARRLEWRAERHARKLRGVREVAEQQGGHGVGAYISDSSPASAPHFLDFGFHIRQDFQCSSHPPNPRLCRLDRGSCLALRCGSQLPSHKPRAGRAEWSERHALSLGRLWVQGPCLDAGPRQATDREIARVLG